MIMEEGDTATLMADAVAALHREISDLRSAVIQVATAADSRRDTLIEIWAMRTIANDTSAPFSWDRVEAKAREFRADGISIETIQQLIKERNDAQAQLSQALDAGETLAKGNEKLRGDLAAAFTARDELADIAQHFVYGHGEPRTLPGERSVSARIAAARAVGNGKEGT